LSLKNWELQHESTNLLHALGIEPYQPPITPIINEAIADEPATKAGILANDYILKVNDKEITHWKEFTDVVVKSIEKPIKLTIRRGDEIKEITFSPRARELDSGEMIGFAGLKVKIEKLPDEMLRKERYDPFSAFVMALQKTKEYTVISFRMLGKLVTGDIGLRTISGPLTIAQGAGASAAIGWQYYLGFLALISISLGVVNLLPIPILDGGHLFFYVIEMITRKPVSERVQIYGFKLGMLFLIFLMAVAFYNDLVRLF
jgi:regulator of sigma E protease